MIQRFERVNASGYRTVHFPPDDPGPPYYARVSTLLNQVSNDGAYAAIPIYRDPACIPADFNLLDAFDPPGPGAFGCPLLVQGTFLIEPNAPLGTFPAQVVTRGPAQVWSVPWPALQSAIADGNLTMTELQALNPLPGTADSFDEMLKPRFENHHVLITSSGRLTDGRRFTFNVNHPVTALAASRSVCTERFSVRCEGRRPPLAVDALLIVGLPF
jgi:hypothetical protein